MLRKSYRADIDGLRAVAVLSVIFHHYLVPGFRGGFVGVDVFFVISGYLIAAHIESDLGRGRFSLIGFYERRIRRILPAFFFMYALFLVLAWVVYFPPDLHFQTRLAAYAIPFIANQAFFQNAGSYGGAFAAHIALLHTWSLAVEEQFYLFFPLIMLAIARFVRSRYLLVLWPATLASLLLCVIGTYVAPTAAFYLAPFRSWELLAGALLAVSGLSPPVDRRVRATVALFGLMLIGGADLFLSSSTRYPGWWALIPCLGAIAVLYASSDRSFPIGRLLDNPVLQRVGLWSYSLYLVHWPCLVLVQYYAFEPMSIFLRALLLGITFVFGWLSWRWIEQPFRGPGGLLSRPAIYCVAGVVAIALFATTLLLHRAEDPRRYSARERILFPDYTQKQIDCRNSSPSDTPTRHCKLGDMGVVPATLVWGDSHALALLPAVDAAFARHHEAAMFAQQGGCPPLLDVRVRDFSASHSTLGRAWIEAHGIGRSERCKRETEAVLKWVGASHIGTVILAGHWIAYTEDAHSRVLTDPQSPENPSMRDNAAVFERGLERLVAVLERQRVRIVVVDDAPQSTVNVPYALRSIERLHLARDFRISRAEYDAQQRSATAIFVRLQERHRLLVVTPQDLLCAGGMCSIARGDAPLYSDEEHLSELGAMIAEPALEAIWAGGS